MTSATAGAMSVLTCALSAACATSGAMQSASAELDRGHKSYILPAVEIVAMDAAVNLAGRLVLEPANFEVTPASIRRNLRSPWVFDDDPFEINQFLHPYQGAMYHGIARSNGLGYWPSVAYTFTASALWEIAGETTPPSRNDQIASGIAGSFLGEPLFRISRLLLERADRGPGFWRTLGSVLASPPTGLNHMMVGDPAGSLETNAVPFSDIRVQVGAIERRSHVALSMDHGYPGNGAYGHERPFDYFRIESRLSNDGLEQLTTRGLLAGADYEAGRLSALWGLYGTYDYFAPESFQFSSTGFSVGTTLQARISESLVVQSSGLLGAGYAARSGEPTDGRDYHYGFAPQAVANVRLIAGRRAALDLTAREYSVGAGRFGGDERDRVFVRDASLAVRVYRRHGVGVTYQLAGHGPDERATVGVYYTFLGSGGFGAAR
jgi:hypothetical protein